MEIVGNVGGAGCSNVGGSGVSGAGSSVFGSGNGSDDENNSKRERKARRI